MAERPSKPQGPQRRDQQKRPSTPGPDRAGRSHRGLVIAIAAVGILAVAAVAGWLAFGGSGTSSADAPKLLAAAGCDLKQVKSLKSNDHSILVASGTSSKWNTDPPTSGPHYAIPVLWGAYTAPVNLGQLVHNLEHGGVYILYGSKVPSATVDELQSFYDDHQNATVLAPLPRLGDKIALGAWTTKSAAQNDLGVAYLATCTAFDEAAYAAFLNAYQGKGPERFPVSSLTPGT